MKIFWNFYFFENFLKFFFFFKFFEIFFFEIFFFENFLKFFVLKILVKNKSTILTKNKLQRIAKNKLQIGKFVKNHSKSLTFLLVCRNLPGKANLKKIWRLNWDKIWYFWEKFVITSGKSNILTRWFAKTCKILRDKSAQVTCFCKML